MSADIKALYALKGHVLHGKHIGGAIGYPTANLPLPPEGERPQNGVYVAKLVVTGEDAVYFGVLNQGAHPTFPDGAPTVEMHLLHGNPTLYDREVTITYLRFLRGERRFANGKALGEQIALDIAQARAFLAEQEG